MFLIHIFASNIYFFKLQPLTPDSERWLALLRLACDPLMGCEIARPAIAVTKKSAFTTCANRYEKGAVS